MIVLRRAHRGDLNTKVWISSLEWQLLVGDECAWFHTSVYSGWMCSTAPLAGEPWVPTVLTDSCENLARAPPKFVIGTRGRMKAAHHFRQG